MTTPDPWSDDRLDAAFTARAATVDTPADLTAATTDAVRAVSARPTRRWWRSLPVAAAAAVLVSVVGFSIAISWPTASAPAPTIPSAPVGSTPSAETSAPSAESSAPAPATSAFGLEIVDVEAALAVRGSGDDDRELAVRGWFSPIPTPSCPSRKVKLLLQDECPDQFVVLQDAPLDLRPQGSADPGESQPPLGPNVELYLDDVDPTWQAIDQPVELVVIGHFDDRRAAYCPKDERQACRDRFVVDRVDRVDGLEQPLSAMNLSEPLEPSRIPDLDRLRAPLDDALILSVLMGEVHDGLPYREPVVLERSLGLDEMAAVWFFRVLVDDVQLTFVRVDGDDALYRVDGDTLVKVDGVPTTGTLATTPPLATPAPPAPVETPSTGRVHMVGLGSPSTGSVTVGVEDQDSLVRDVRAATDEEMRQFGGGTSLEGIRLREFAGQDTFYVSWVGYPCDASARIVLAAAGESGMTLDVYGQHVPCDERTIERAVVLRTLDPMALTAITTTDHLVAREFPSTALGMPVVDVERAQDVQHLAGVSRELAVGGWLSLGPPLMCAAPSGEPTSRLQPGCGDELNWLLERPEILTFQDGPTVALQEPSGPGIHLRFEAPQVDWPSVDDPGTVTPTPTVAIGHFDDPAAATCPPEDAAWCHDLFIIDSIAWAYGHDLGFTGRLDDPKVKSTPDEIAQAIGAMDPAARIVAAWPTPGRGLAESELDLLSVPKAVGTASRVWIVKVIEAGQIRPYLVVDETLAVFRVLDNGSVKRIYGA